MTALRRVFFWLHLAAGISAGVIIVVMSATGVALTYERQLAEWAESPVTPPVGAAVRLSPTELLTRVRQSQPDFRADTLTVRAAPDAAATLGAGREQTRLDPYTGAVLPPSARAAEVRRFLSDMRAWHRWLGQEGEARTSAKAFTGWSNLIFLGLVLSGLYLWLPRVWSWANVRAVSLFRRSYGTAKARDFNWHHVIGFWTAVPLAIVVASAVPISFPWASDAVYRAVGEEPPSRPGGGGGGREGGGASRNAGPGGERRGEGATGQGRGRRAEGREGDQRGREGRSPAAGEDPTMLVGLDHAVAKAGLLVPGWRTLSVRLPQDARATLVVSVDEGSGGQPHLRSTLTFDRTGTLVEREQFADQSLGRRLRSLMRFAHTGEVFGLAGQTVAGLVSAASLVMAWTGFALSWRRLRAWAGRRARADRASSDIVGDAAKA